MTASSLDRLHTIDRLEAINLSPMDNTSQITVSLEWAKKLEEAGWPQFPSLFYWDSHAIQKTHDGYGITEDGEYAAPTAEEILRKLPYSFEKNGKLFFISYGKDFDATEEPDYYGFEGSFNDDGEEFMETFYEIKLSDLAASMYCYLAEHKLLPPFDYDPS